MTKVINEKGIEFDMLGGFSLNATKYAKEKGLPHLICCLAKHPDGAQEYLLLDITNQPPEPIFAHQSFEEIAVHIDIMAFANKYDN